MGTKPMSMRTSTLARLSGGTYRQIDYWVGSGVIPREHWECVGGQGSIRLFDERILDRVRFLVSVSKLFRGGLKTSVLKEIYEKYQDGQVDFNGVKLIWEKGKNGKS